MNNHIKLRAMQEADMPAVLLIEKEQDFPWTEKMLRDCLVAAYENMVLEENGIVLGFGILTIAMDEAEILNIVIAKKQRQRGLGMTLLQHLLALAEQRGAKKVYLEVRVSNIPAINLYQRAGFKTLNIRKDYYPAANGCEDALILLKACY